MGKANFSDDFKRDAVAQITERGYPVAEVSKRLGVSQHSPILSGASNLEMRSEMLFEKASEHINQCVLLFDMIREINNFSAVVELLKGVRM